MHTYFVSNGSAIKSGKADNVTRRIKQLQTSSSNKLRLLFSINNDCERQMHQMFIGYRTSGEWFTPTKEIFEFLHRDHGEEQPASIIAKLQSLFFLPQTTLAPTHRTLQCPFCGDEYQHPLPPSISKGSLRIAFTCEHGHYWALQITEQRGHGSLYVVPAIESDFLLERGDF